MKSTGLLLLATALAAAGCDTTPTQPDAQPPEPSFSAAVTTEHQTIPFDNEFFSDCSGEVIHFVGSIHVVLHTVSNASGGLVINGSANFQGVMGVGLLSGLPYQLVGKSGIGFNGPAVYPASGLVVERGELTQLIVSQGLTLNQEAKLQYRLVITPDGTIRVEFDSLTFTCYGVGA